MTARRIYPSFASVLLTNCLAVALVFTLSPVVRADVTLDGSLGVSGPIGSGTVSGTPTTYLITHNLGQRSANGMNLFHSFGTFNLSSGESATFTGPTGIANIISRVTGGAPSSIDGLIRSTIDGANLFLLNPSGIMFGPGARLDVSGSFHASTAQYLKFANGEIFNANTTSNSVLSVADPVTFGFLAANPAPISAVESVLAVPVGKSLSIIGGDITFNNNPARETYLPFDPALGTSVPGPTYYMLSAPGGEINIAGVRSSGEIDLSTPDRGIASFASLGNITLTSGANINVAHSDYLNQSAGSVVISGGQMLFQNMGFSGFLPGIEASGNPGGSIDIRGDSLHLDNTSLQIINFGDTNDHPGTACRIDLSQEFRMTNASWIATYSFPIDTNISYASARAGDIQITARNIALGDNTPGTGPLADIGVYGFVFSTTSGSGRGGDITLAATADLTVKNGFFVNTGSTDEGAAGNVTVRADTMNILDQGHISSDAYYLGNGGIVDVAAREILLSGTNEAAVSNSFAISGLAAQTEYWANGGKIKVLADNLSILDGAKISTILNGADFEAIGNGADVDIRTKNLTVSGYIVAEGTPPYLLSAVDARVNGLYATGTGGNISLATDTLNLASGGVIRTGLYNDAPGNAGSITVNAKTIDIASRGQIYADSFRGTGNSGDITVNAATLNITGANNVPRPGPLDFDFTGLSTTTNAGTGGKIAVALSGDLTLSHGGGIKADTQGTGSGGAIDITAANMGLSGSGTEINALSANSGAAGNIAIKTGLLTLADGSNITTQAKGEGAGGAISVIADALALTGAGQITSSTSGTGNSGKIAVTLTGDLKATSGGGISADTSSSGIGGSISVDAVNVALADKGFLGASSGGSGHAGEIFIKSGRLVIENGGSIATRAADTGDAGRITVETGALQMASAGQISSSSAKSGNAGNISITSSDSIYLRDSSITTEALLADGGNISIKAPGTIRLDNSTLTASVNGEQATTGGNIIIDPQYVILKGSDVIATAHKGTGGNIDITANVFLADAGSTVSAASELGFPGSVNIRAPNDVSNIVTPLSADYTSASALLRERCMARIREGKYSSFVVGGRDGLPVEPGNMIPGFIQ